MLEAKILLAASGIILVVLFWVLYGIASELQFERKCFEFGGKTLRTDDGLVCIKSDAILFK